MENKKLTVTVQGVINPVPAALESGNAGFQSSRSCYRKDSTPVAHLAGLENKATGKIQDNEKFIMENPFRRNSGILRSPPLVAKSPTPTTTVVATMMNQAQNSAGSSFTELGSLITNLMEYVKNRNNVHHAIKEQIRDIKAKYNKAKDEIPVIANKEKNYSMEQSTQTSPNSSEVAKELKRSRDSVDSPTRMQTPKRIKKVKKSKNYKEIGSDAVQEVQKLYEEGLWKTVKRKQNTRKRTPRSEAMIISTKGETTYADILRKMKADPALQDLGENVSRIRRTQKGDLLLEIKPMNNDFVEKFQEKVEKSIGSQANIRTNKPEIRIECKDLDEVTTKQEICIALKNQLGREIDEASIKNLRRSYGDTQTAIISLPVELGMKLIKLGKIKIGWVICRLREHVSLKRCFRCLEFGHIASRCTNTEDRSKMCRRCGENGHIAKDCAKKPECTFCKKQGKVDTLHVAGSIRCPVFKTALSNLRR